MGLVNEEDGYYSYSIIAFAEKKILKLKSHVILTNKPTLKTFRNIWQDIHFHPVYNRIQIQKENEYQQNCN